VTLRIEASQHELTISNRVGAIGGRGFAIGEGDLCVELLAAPPGLLEAMLGHAGRAQIAEWSHSTDGPYTVAAAARIADCLVVINRDRAASGNAIACARRGDLARLRLVTIIRVGPGRIGWVFGANTPPEQFGIVVREALTEWIASLLDPSTGFLDALDTVEADLGEVLRNKDVRDDAELKPVIPSISARLRLPRFDLGGYADDVFDEPRRTGYLLAATAMALVATVSLALGWRVEAGAACALACYTGAFVAAAQNDKLTPLLLLRIPAATSVGAAAVLTFDPDWMVGLQGRPAFGIAVGAGFVALGYLANEARSHGVRDSAALARRSLVVLVIAAAHAVAIALVTVAFALPVFHGSDPVPELPASISLGPTLAVFASTSLLLGLIVQVLWDDKPVTAPLSHGERISEVAT
jgi:hypothetical protein